MALDGVSTITFPQASTDVKTSGLDGAGSVPLSRVKLVPETKFSVSVTFNWPPFVRSLVSVSVKPIYRQFYSDTVLTYCMEQSLS